MKAKSLTRVTGASAAAALCTALASQVLAAAPPTSAYATDVQNSHVEDATSEGIGQVNMITCIMASMRPAALVNQGAYNALVNESRCEPNGSSGGASSDAAQAGSFMTAVVNPTRASNNDPMISKIWITQEEEGKKTLIDVHVSATAAPTAGNPYGSFELFYCGHEDSTSACRMNGFLEGSTTGVRYFQSETRDDGQGVDTQTTALRLSASGTNAGSGRMQIDSTLNSASSVFDFAYDASLYLRDDGAGNQQCFSRDASDADTGMSVWRYGLYNPATGARIERNSGFPIDFTQGGQTWHGYLGYFGLQLPSDAMAALNNGGTVQKVDYNGGTAVKTNFTVVKAGGRLLKFTRQTRTLQQIDGIHFNAFIGNAAGLYTGAESNTQYEMYWDDAAGKIKVTGKFACGNNGCQSIALPSEEEVNLAFWQSLNGVQGYSQSLGGEVFIDLGGVSFPVTSSNSPDIDVVYRTQDLVYPAQVPEHLFCVRDCMTGLSLAAYFAPNPQSASPFASNSHNRFMPAQRSEVVEYDGDATLLLADDTGASISASDPALFEQQQEYRNGIRSGRLFEDLAVAECAPSSGTYCDFKVNDADVYYQWETGPNSHNQFAAVKDSTGTFVAFDAPLQVNFQVPTGAAYGSYSGKSLVLQYGGFGDLWGIPGFCVSRLTNEETACDSDEARYVPSFIIPFNETTGRVSAGNDTYLVKWLDREIRFAKKQPSVCANAGLTTSAGTALPTVAVLKSPSDPNSSVYIGTKPVVTAAPRVIHGEVKY